MVPFFSIHAPARRHGCSVLQRPAANYVCVPGARVIDSAVMADVTPIINAIENGDPHAAALLLPVVYDELRKLAADKMVQEKAGQTLQATALVQGVRPTGG